jgi:hypothetical protein
MADLKNRKYVIDELKRDSRDLLAPPPMDSAGLQTAMKSHTKLLSLDDTVLKGSFYVESVWIWPGKDIYPETAEPLAHAHTYDEVITFFGTDYENPNDLCGEIEIWLEDEKFILTRSSMIFVPKGMMHCPLVIHKVEKPIFHFATGTGALYAQQLAE